MILKHTKVYVTVLYCVNIQLWYKIIIDTTRKNNFYRMWINSELSVSDEITQNCHGYQNVRIRKPRSKTMISTECFAKMTESAIDYFLKFWLSQILTVTIVCVLALLAMEVCVCRSHVRTRQHFVDSLETNHLSGWRPVCTGFWMSSSVLLNSIISIMVNHLLWILTIWHNLAPISSSIKTWILPRRHDCAVLIWCKNSCLVSCW